MYRLIKKFLIVLIVMLVLAGCGEKKDTLEILFFSQITEDIEDDVINELEQIYPESTKQFQSKFYASVYERLIGEIAAHNGDILIVEADMLTPGTFDSEGLVPFKLTEDRKNQISQDYKLIYKKTNEEQVYAMPINKKSALFENLDIELDMELVALVPIYSEHQDLAVQIGMEFSGFR
ncbi:hypothetical protein M3E13_05565 [Oceanobacillus kimchii]|uniref:hypothetical protein n=1 Tax=Oceanobacillus kimchii TaxID=746691 RepID=UPI0021A4A485|nr:hypothetical protein [Oceanobacillus kimchii]MCT1575743.1 hypothetical protein [Oceanobacillus kimchii]MCT2135380.1 hypothetical protein [Oceanobacillus kimchii]